MAAATTLLCMLQSSSPMPAAAEIPGASGAPPAGRPDVDDLAMSGVGTVPDHVVSALSGDDAHTHAGTPERRAI